MRVRRSNLELWCARLEEAAIRHYFSVPSDFENAPLTPERLRLMSLDFGANIACFEKYRGGKVIGICFMNMRRG